MSSNRRIVLNIVFIVFFVLLALLALFMQTNSTYRDNYMFSNKYRVNKGFLTGVYSHQNKIDSYDEMVSFYYKHNCQNKFFAALPSLPLIYSALERKAYGNQAWIRLGIGNEITLNKIYMYLIDQKDWCIILAPEYNETNKEYIKNMEAFLMKNSENCYEKEFANDGGSNTPVKLVFCYR